MSCFCGTLLCTVLQRPVKLINKPHLTVDPSVKALAVISQETNGATFCEGQIYIGLLFLSEKV